MAVPPPNAACWQSLANGGLARLRTQNIGTQMLAKRLERSSMSTAEKARELHDYYSKWERGLADEIAQFAR